VKLVPYYSGKYDFPGKTIDKIFVILDGKPISDLSNIAPKSEINKQCDSDVPTTILNCCEKYSFVLFASFKEQGVKPIRLDSIYTNIKSKKGCKIMDMDPHN
jgi:hypothetical protein